VGSTLNPLHPMSLLSALVALLPLLSACGEGQRRVATPSSSTAVTNQAAPATTATFWYPAGTNQELKLIWVIQPAIDESEGGPRRPLEIIAQIGQAVHRVTLGPHDGVLIPSEQSFCNPSLKNATDVSLINFYTMGPETIVARRTQPTRLEILFTVEADDEPAKTHGTLATIPIPADAHIVDTIAKIVDGGREVPIDCSSKV
jgi:hypothetical protein